MTDAQHKVMELAMIQNDEIDALQALAKAATPGPWRACGSDRGGYRCCQIWSTVVDFPVATAFKHDEQVGSAPEGKPEANAAFIAAANPQVVDALIDRLRKAESASEWISREQAISMVATGLPTADLIKQAFGMGAALRLNQLSADNLLRIARSGNATCMQNALTNVARAMKAAAPDSAESEGT